MLKLSEGTAGRRRFPFYLADSADGSGRTGKAGQTFAAAEIQVSKNGAAWGNMAGSAGETGNGAYYYEFTAGELDTLGVIGIKIKKTGCILGGAAEAGVQMWDEVRAADMNDAIRLGLTALPNAAAEAAGGVYTRGTGAGQINQPANGSIDARMVDASTAGSAAITAAVPSAATIAAAVAAPSAATIAAAVAAPSAATIAAAVAAPSAATIAAAVNAPSAAAIADAVLEEIVAGHAGVDGSLAQAIVIIKGLVNGNVVHDQQVYDGAGLLTGVRIRVFPTAADVVALTNLVKTFTVTAVNGPNGPTAYQVVES